MVTAIIVAGGKGTRMAGDTAKQYIMLAGVPVLGRTLKLFDSCASIGRILLVVSEKEIDYCENSLLPPLRLKKETIITAGGAERQDSVYNGLRALADTAPGDIIAIHDGVRPLARPETINECVAEAEKTGACIPGVPAFDTLKKPDSKNIIAETIDRNGIWMAKTPQAFQYSLIMEAHNSAKKDGFRGTDDASLVERLGRPVKIIQGSRNNIKITTKEDLVLAEAIITAQNL